MKILEVSNGCPSTNYPLNGIFQMDQAKALTKIGNHVVFIALDIRSIRKKRRFGLREHIYESIPVIDFNVPVGPVPRFIRRIICSFGFRMAYRRYYRKNGKPDVIHVHFNETAEAIVRLCKKKQIKYVVTEHDSGINESTILKQKLKSITKVYQNAGAVISVSSVLGEKIRKYTNVIPFVIPNIVDLNLFTFKRKSHSPFQYIAAGNLNERKRFSNLVLAFKKTIEAGINAQLLIMGDGPERNNLMLLIKEQHLEKKVNLFGPYIRQEFATKLAESDCFVLPSCVETFGVVCIEALSCGVPVVATRCGGPEDFINDSNGFLVGVDDIDGLADSMIDMYKFFRNFDLELISKKTRNSFSDEVIAKKIENVLALAEAK